VYSSLILVEVVKRAHSGHPELVLVPLV